MIPGSGRSGEGKGYPPQYSSLENSLDCIVFGVAKSQTRLSNFHKANMFFKIIKKVTITKMGEYYLCTDLTEDSYPDCILVKQHLF